MRIKIIENPITCFGDFSRGQVIDDSKYPVSFLNHLVDECGAAERLQDYETKVDKDYEAKKNSQSIPSLQPAKVSRRKMSKSQIKRRQSLQSTTRGN